MTTSTRAHEDGLLLAAVLMTVMMSKLGDSGSFEGHAPILPQDFTHIVMLGDSTAVWNTGTPFNHFDEKKEAGIQTQGLSFTVCLMTKQQEMVIGCTQLLLDVYCDRMWGKFIIIPK